MISFNNVSKYYLASHDANIILKDVNLEIPAGEHLGILSPSGAGKSTIINMMAGLDDPDEGAIIVHGNTSWPIGFAGGFHPELTGWENVRILAALHGLDEDQIAIFCQEFTKLGESYFQPLSTYSSGKRATLAFALSMAMDFDIFLADEVVAAGTGLFRLSCEMLLEARIEHKTFVFFSRNQRALDRFCRSAAVLHNGKIQRCEDFDEAAKLLDQ
jgi:capsular polysaccharide transport system ATP-binding protein